MTRHSRSKSDGARPSKASDLPIIERARLDTLRAELGCAKFARFLDQSIAEIYDCTTRLLLLFEQSDAAETARAAHDLVRLAANIGAPRLSAFARALGTAYDICDVTAYHSASIAFGAAAAEALTALKGYRAA